MTDKKNRPPILCFGTDWDFGVTSRTHVMTRLGRDYDILYVSKPPPIRKAVSSGNYLIRPCIRSIEHGLRVVQFPAYLSTSYRPWVERLFMPRRVRMIRRMLNRMSPHDPLLYVWSPNAAPYLPYFPQCRVLYHVFDNHAALRGVPHIEGDHLIARRADAIVTVSRSLAGEYSFAPREPEVIHNGVDYATFSVKVAAGDEPSDLRRIPRPRLSVVAKFSNFVSYRVLQSLADTGRYELVLVGPQLPLTDDNQAAFRKLTAHDHVSWLGPKPHDEVAKYLWFSDVCLIPLDDVPNTRFCATPLKLFEYFAAGRPVVSTQLPDMQSFGGLLRFASTIDDWTAQIDAALTEDNEQLQQARRALAEQNSWDRISQRVAGIVDRIMHERPTVTMRT